MEISFIRKVPLPGTCQCITVGRVLCSCTSHTTTTTTIVQVPTARPALCACVKRVFICAHTGQTWNKIINIKQYRRTCARG